uniref:DUF4158 domain-containing protein n=2 Tax=Macrostomum lignano TaxID=282301 RepID=A0A1I8GC66_9PLAT
MNSLEESAENIDWYSSNIKAFDFDEGSSKNGGVTFWDDPTQDKVAQIAAKKGPSIPTAPKSVIADQPAMKLIKCSGPCGLELRPDDRYYHMYLPYCRHCLIDAKQPERLPAKFNTTIDRVNFILRQKLRHQTVLTDWLGDPLFRSMEGKRILLQQAVKFCDGDAVIASLLFLRRSLKPTVFKEEACRNQLRGQAVLHWLAHLQQADEIEEYKDCLLSYVPAATGEPPDIDAVAAMNLDRALSNNSDPAMRASALRRFKVSETGASRGLLGAAQTCLDLLDKQLELDKLINEVTAGRPDVYPLLRARPPMTSLTLNAFAEQLMLLAPDLDRLAPDLTKRSLDQLAGLMASPRDQAAWSRITAIAKRLHQAAEAGNEREVMQQRGLMEAAVLERGGGGISFIQRQQRPVLSWPISRQIEHLRRLGASETLLEKLKKLG